MQYVKISGRQYPVDVIYGKIRDVDWDERETKEIVLPMTYEQASALFVDGVSWSIVDVWEDESGETHTDEFDESEFGMVGSITDHMDGTLTVKMGRETDLELAYELLYGGE